MLQHSAASRSITAQLAAVLTFEILCDSEELAVADVLTPVEAPMACRVEGRLSNERAV
jgi:hypothetical protein